MADLIDRQVALDALNHELRCGAVINQCGLEMAYEVIEGLPSVEPQIIYCKDCEKHNKARGYSYDGTFVGIMDACPLVEIRGKAQGHEFDYQYCVYAERREDG